MYQSRRHFENESLHLALDAMTGEILELNDRKNHENLIKNAMFDLPQPFTILLSTDTGSVELAPPHSRCALEHPELRCTITEECREGEMAVTVSYPCLTDGKDPDTVYPVTFIYTAVFFGGGIRWNSTVRNGTGYMIREVRFPVINGIWMTEDPKTNVLYYPHYAGERIPDPVSYLTQPVSTIEWRWQEYRYTYLLSGKYSGGDVARRGLSGYSDRYPGGTSMSWMELDDPTRGFYFGCHDPLARPVTLECGVRGNSSPGVCMAAGFSPRVAGGEEYRTPEVLTELHTGDWHRGAEIYRAFRAPLLAPKRQSPAWVRTNPGLFAHYDFKYQNGGIVHRYRDIPRLAEEALAAGVCHILLAGWHRDGFDHGFPMYEPDPELGTEAELIEGIRLAKERGVHTVFYMNILIHNRDYDPANVDAKAIMEENGTVSSESYGNPKLRFSAMCPGSSLWQEQIEGLVRRATTVYGADGIYFDQLGCGVRFCFNPEHHHAFDAGAEGYRKILSDVSDTFRKDRGEEMCIMGEWPVDLYGSLVDYQLNQTFFNYHTGGFPEMYRYTFPQHGVTDMLYPGENLAMRPVHVAQKSQEIMGRLFCSGCYFWVYDLADDNTFTRDPAGFERLKTVIRLSSLRQRYAPDAMFLDDDGITTMGNGALYVKRFSDGARDLLLTYALPGAEETAVRTDFPITSAVLLDADGDRRPLAVRDDTVILPPETAVILLEKETL